MSQSDTISLAATTNSLIQLVKSLFSLIFGISKLLIGTSLLHFIVEIKTNLYQMMNKSLWTSVWIIIVFSLFISNFRFKVRIRHYSKRWFCVCVCVLIVEWNLISLILNRNSLKLCAIQLLQKMCLIFFFFWNNKPTKWDRFVNDHYNYHFRFRRNLSLSEKNLTNLFFRIKTWDGSWHKSPASAEIYENPRILNRIIKIKNWERFEDKRKTEWIRPFDAGHRSVAFLNLPHVLCHLRFVWRLWLSTLYCTIKLKHWLLDTRHFIQLIQHV